MEIPLASPLVGQSQRLDGANNYFGQMLPPVSCKPLLKWPGGKRWLASLLAPTLCRELKGRYIEPFVGGGAMFIAIKPRRALLSDSNRGLISTLRVIRVSHEQVFAIVSRFSNTKSCYLKVRASNPKTRVGNAARFLYLNRTCWGGIQRFNRQGRFNVPFGNSGRIVCRCNQVHEFARLLTHARLEYGDFESRIDSAMKGDVVYADPPYTTIGANNGFIRYNEHLFSWSDQKRLADSANRARQRGVFVVVSGLWHPELLALYKGWWAIRLKRFVCVSRTSSGRRPVFEAVLFSKKPTTLPNCRLL